MGPRGRGEKNVGGEKNMGARRACGREKHDGARGARYCTVTVPSGTVTSASLATTTLFPGFSGSPGHSGT